MVDFVGGSVWGRFDSSPAIVAQSGGFASIVRAGAGVYHIARAANTRGWTAADTMVFCQPEGAAAVLCTVNIVSAEQIDVDCFNVAGAGVDVPTFSLMVQVIE